MSSAPVSAATTNLPKQARVRGEPFVWLTGMGLVVAFAMATILMLVILGNGLAVFWPKRIVEYTLVEGDKTTTIAGSELQRVERYQDGVKTEPEVDLHVFTGNKDAYGNGFRYLHLATVTAQKQPTELMQIERLEYGDAIGYPVELKLKDPETKKVEKIPAQDARFEAELLKRIADVSARWEQIRALEKGAIGENAKAIAEGEIKLKKLPVGDERTAVEKRVAELKTQYTDLSQQAGVLRGQQNRDKLVLRLASGESRDLPLGKIVEITWPNRMGFFERIGAFCHRMVSFVWDNPREANTEGGIFPAIFGTFVMTLMMSVCVVPVGVLAAVYLREYAKQGPMVRAVRIAVNNLAGVPSIVFGVFGLGFFVYIMGAGIDELFYSDYLPNPTFGTGGILWAAATLSLMTVPVVIVATEEAIAAVPRGVKEASLAMGASKWQTIQRIVLPASIPGILTGAILAMARGAGEVAPLMLVGVVKLAPTLPINGSWPFVHLDQKFMHLGFHIYDLGFQSPDSEAAKPAVFATTLFLILLVLILNLAAITMRERLRRRFRTSAF
jgi:phosphate transport system permease protein